MDWADVVATPKVVAMARAKCAIFMINTLLCIFSSHAPFIGDETDHDCVKHHGAETLPEAVNPHFKARKSASEQVSPARSCFLNHTAAF